MVDLADENKTLKADVVPIIKKMMNDGSLTIQSRSIKLLMLLGS
jgi:hypothetical protein